MSHLTELTFVTALEIHIQSENLCLQAKSFYFHKQKQALSHNSLPSINPPLDHLYFPCEDASFLGGIMNNKSLRQYSPYALLSKIARLLLSADSNVSKELRDYIKTLLGWRVRSNTVPRFLKH